MFFGLTVSLESLMVFGILLFVLLVTQTLIGLRVIKLGKVHRVWHRRLAFAIVALAALHGFAAMALYFGWRVL
jgi:hypothetical protein